eukprot:6102411-Pyramimonas_sp.AAC.1
MKQRITVQATWCNECGEQRTCSSMWCELCGASYVMQWLWHKLAYSRMYSAMRGASYVVRSKL